MCIERESKRETEREQEKFFDFLIKRLIITIPLTNCCLRWLLQLSADFILHRIQLHTQTK